MSFKFSRRSLDAFVGVHPDLVVLASMALCSSPMDFGVIQGRRTAAQQHGYFLAGTSKLDEPPPPGQQRGRHLTGHAIDILVYIDGVGTQEKQYYPRVMDVFKTLAKQMNIPIVCGIDNPHWTDAYHVELDRIAYPDEAPLLIA